MSIFRPPLPQNETVLGYAPGSAERASLEVALNEMLTTTVDVPMYINGEEIRTQHKVDLTQPHKHAHVLGQYNQGNTEHLKLAIDAALKARDTWANTVWQHRAAVFLKAADLISGKYRSKINAATMLCQSKNAYQAEIDSACELADFLRYNVGYMTQIYQEQPNSSAGMWNRTEQRPLEGFVFALSPFNFTAIAGNLPSAPALMGNVVVWKPSNSQIYSARVIMEIFIEAGLPKGVINLIYVSGGDAGRVIFKHRDFAGIHFTGSTAVFQSIWKSIADNIENYKTYPRIVGETGGKDFVLAHPSANAQAVATGLVRGAFEYQGQKCSAASRAYLPKGLWPEIKASMERDLAVLKMGPVTDFTNFVNAVINEAAFDKIKAYIDRAQSATDAAVIMGGTCNKSVGYFIQPTVILTTNPHYETMEEEIFGPVLTIYLYEDNAFDQALDLVDTTSVYALTGAIFSQDREAIIQAEKHLVHAAGNFYINDKPTGAVVGQQPFGGGRASGTNDKAGGMVNLLRWVSPRTIKETFNPAEDFRYPFLG